MSLDEEYFDLSDIKPEKRIGQGTFGDVYLGIIKKGLLAQSPGGTKHEVMLLHDYF